MSNITICDVCNKKIEGFFSQHMECKYWYYDNSLIFPFTKKKIHVCYFCFNKLKEQVKK